MIQARRLADELKEGAFSQDMHVKKLTDVDAYAFRWSDDGRAFFRLESGEKGNTHVTWLNIASHKSSM
jgi:hypothetical protein